MAGYTREIYQVGQNGEGRRYAGYGKFDGDGKYLGSRGGYNSTGKPNAWSGGLNSRSANQKSGYTRNEGEAANRQNPSNGASFLQNNIRMSGKNQAKRTKKAFGR